MGDPQFTERELDVMSVLWESGSGTVAEVRDRLQGQHGYTSVLKVLQVLEEKGHVRHEREGRAYRYLPTVRSAEAGNSALDRVLNKIFHGSVDRLVAQLVAERELTSDEVARLRALVDGLEDTSPTEDAP